jgi:hypothetical protein
LGGEVAPYGATLVAGNASLRWAPVDAARVLNDDRRSQWLTTDDSPIGNSHRIFRARNALGLLTIDAGVRQRVGQGKPVSQWRLCGRL